MMQDRKRCLGCYSWQTDESDPDLIVCRNCGLVSAKCRQTTAVYDQAYVAERYDKYATTREMSELRAHIVQSVIMMSGKMHMGRLLDVGYGNGDFIRSMTTHGWEAYGNDVNPTPYEGVRRVCLPTGWWPENQRYKVITFFDCLEHFEEFTKVREVARNTDWIFLSYPMMPAGFPTAAVKSVWKHYRPGEHHHFFTPGAVQRLFSTDRRACDIAYVGYPEDAIRGAGLDGQPNIQTVGLRFFNRA
jgi:hypothetical protein